MENIALKIIDETFENEGFVIDNDVKAEWALKKIAEEKEESQRYINICDSMITEYTIKKLQASEKLKSKTSYLISQLQKYFESVPHKSSKTQETYKLPSGTLKKKLPTFEYERDEKVLGEFLKNNGFVDDYEVVIKPKWNELKKAIKIQGDKVVSAETGEIIEGITVQEKPATFLIEY